MKDKENDKNRQQEIEIKKLESQDRANELDYQKEKDKPSENQSIVEEKKEKEKEKEKKPYNIVVPFNVPGKPDIGLLDLNEIFKLNINYNFDSLKSLLEGLVSSYKKSEEELESIKSYNRVKDIKIKELEQKLLDLNILISNSLGNAEEVEKLKEMKLQLEKEIIEQPKEVTKAVIKNAEAQGNNNSMSTSIEKPIKKPLKILF